MLFNWKTSYNIISFLTKQPKQWQEYIDILKEGIQKINPKHHIDILINVRLTALNYTFTYIQCIRKMKRWSYTIKALEDNQATDYLPVLLFLFLF
ncbi:hypothetical protein, partial [Thomasclavelia cocleata]|uniref:hypothetical protein n=1 Tax=Thomasclavelia cocleata TaxID=69824 RepID=UPI002431991E